MPRHRIALTLGCLVVLAGSFLPGSPITAPATAGGSALDLPDDHPQRVELRKLAACDRIVRGDLRGASPEHALVLLGQEMGVEIVFEGSLPPGLFMDRLEGLTLEQALLEIRRRAGIFYRVHDAHTLTASSPLLAGVGSVTNPVLIKESKVEPVYPEEAKESGLGGTVILQALILTDGTVDDIKVLKASPDDQPWFIDSAREAVRQWRYEPATKDGDPVPVYFTVFVEFKLD